MMKKQWLLSLVVILGCLAFYPASDFCGTDAWGFFGHKRINRLAVFTLPQNLFGFYKKNIEYVTEHAVDPDKRRYATKYEAIRHYIDIDHWGAYPYENVDREYSEAVLNQARFFLINEKGDSIDILNPKAIGWGTEYVQYNSKRLKQDFDYNYLDLLSLFRNELFFTQKRYEDDWIIPAKIMRDSLHIKLPSKVKEVHVIDQFSEYGILPYYLLTMQRKLTKAFKEKDQKSILRLSADFGHYIGDAHVPLHTTENYNGQLTNQIGIHGFWESRIPELFADREWDYMVGGAEYITDPKDYFWDIVLTSSLLVDSVLTIEKRLSETFPVDLQNCYTDRNGRNIKTQCEEYSRAFDNEMKGMVEERMQSSIKAVGSVWYTCWVDGGRPNLDNLLDVKIASSAKDSIPASKVYKSRTHDN